MMEVLESGAIRTAACAPYEVQTPLPRLSGRWSTVVDCLDTAHSALHALAGHTYMKTLLGVVRLRKCWLTQYGITSTEYIRPHTPGLSNCMQSAQR